MDDNTSRDGRRELPPREEMPGLHTHSGAVHPRNAQAAQQQQ